MPLTEIRQILLPDGGKELKIVMVVFGRVMGKGGNRLNREEIGLARVFPGA